MCLIFQARMLGRIFSVTSSEMAQSDRVREAFDSIVSIVSATREFLPPERWLTIQFELGYSNADICATDEANRWLQTFLNNLKKLEEHQYEKNGDNATKKLSTHWIEILGIAEQKLALISFAKLAQQFKSLQPT